MTMAGHVRSLALLAVSLLVQAPTTHAGDRPGRDCRPPRGIYALDDARGVHRDGKIRDYPFVTGYTLRMAWSAFESAPGHYDFSPIDHIIARLEPLGKKLTLLRGSGGSQAGEPAYVAAAPGTTTYWYANTRRRVGLRRAVPWDPYLQDRFRAFVRALADHRVPSQARGGLPVPLREHPVLANLNLGIPGLGPIRERETRLTQMPGYSRARLIDAIKEGLATVTDAFPDTVVFVGFWSVRDHQTEPPLWEAIRSAVLAEFDGQRRPRVGFWQENLAARLDPVTGAVKGFPSSAFAAPLHRSRHEAYAMFQALQGWQQPFEDRSKTANASPADALQYAYETFGTTYVELYAADLDHAPYWPELTEWGRRLQSLPASGCGAPGAR